jgi:exopolysaccharide production protein ExoZ
MRGVFSHQTRSDRLIVLSSIQVLRGVAAVMVVLFHVLGFQIGAAGVDIFFVISGFIMFYTNREVFGNAGAGVLFLKHRILRIAPLYLLCTAVALWPKVEIKTLVASVFFVPIRSGDGSIHTVLAPGWTLNFEMFFYIVFATGLMLPRKYGLSVIIMTLSVLTLIGLATSPTTAAFLYWTNPLILEFVFGLVIAYAFEIGKTLPPEMGMGMLALGALVLAAFSFSHYHTPNRLDAGYLTIGWGLPAALIVAGAALSDRGALATARWRIPQLLGDASYSIYLTHLLVLGAVGSFHIPHLGIPTVLAILLVGIGVHFYVERPIGRFLRSRFSTSPQYAQTPA